MTGGGFWNRRQHTFQFLDLIHAEVPVILLIHGAAEGADTLCAEWAEDRGIEDLPFKPDWIRYGQKSAGKARNQQMVEEGKPGAIAVFPGEAGTSDMRRRARQAGLTEFRWVPGITDD